jgi:hypothetical protein
MPCTYIESQAEIDARQAASRKRWADLQEAFCWAMTELENENSYQEDDFRCTAEGDKAYLLWQEHEAKETERIRAEAAAKLTPRERRVLGLA